MNNNYIESLLKKGAKLDKEIKKKDYQELYRKDERFKNFTEFYDYVKGINYHDFLFGKSKQELTEEELEEKRKKAREEHILREEFIERDDFKFYVWIYKGTDSHLEFDNDYNCRHITKRMYETSIIIEFYEKVDKGYLYHTFDGLLTTRSYKENKALRDYEKIFEFIKNESIENIMNRIYADIDNAILYYKEKKYKKNRKK